MSPPKIRIAASWLAPNLERLYAEGAADFPRDLDKAIAMDQKWALRGDSESITGLAKAYATGVPKVEVRAYAWSFARNHCVPPNSKENVDREFGTVRNLWIELEKHLTGRQRVEARDLSVIIVKEINRNIAGKPIRSTP